MRFAADVDPVRAQDSDRVGMESSSDALPALTAWIVPADMRSSERFCDLRPSAVARAQEQHPRPSTRAPRASTGRSARVRGATRGAAHRRRPAAPPGTRSGRSRSSCRGGPPNCAVRSPVRLRGADAGGTTPSSAARRSAPSAPSRSGRSARVLAAAATAAGATPAARTVADRPEGRRPRTGGSMHSTDTPSLRLGSIQFDALFESIELMVMAALPVNWP